MSMLHAPCIHAPYLRFHAACPFFMSMLLVCCMSVLHIHAACPCCTSMLHVLASCQCCCPFCMPMLYVRELVAWIWTEKNMNMNTNANVNLNTKANMNSNINTNMCCICSSTWGGILLLETTVHINSTPSNAAINTVTVFVAAHGAS